MVAGIGAVPRRDDRVSSNVRGRRQKWAIEGLGGDTAGGKREDSINKLYLEVARDLIGERHRVLYLESGGQRSGEW